MSECSINSKIVLYVRVQYKLKIILYVRVQYSLKNPHCMSECSASFQKFPLSVRIQCIISYQHYAISVVYFHVINYTTEYNVSFVSAQRLQKLCVYCFAAICQTNNNKGGNCRHLISGQLDVDVTENSYDEKIMNRSWIFEIEILKRA